MKDAEQHRNEAQDRLIELGLASELTPSYDLSMRIEEAARQAPVSDDQGGPRYLRWYRRTPPIFRHALAAACVVVAVGIILWIQQHRLQRESEARDASLRVLSPFGDHPPLVQETKTAKTVADIMALPRNTQYFECSDFDDDMAEELAKLRWLKSVMLSGSRRLTDRGVRALATIPLLETLTLYGCSKVTDGGASALGRLANLQSLDLSRTAVSDSSVKVLARLPRLTKLDLCGCDIGDAALVALGEMKLLEFLQIWDCVRVTDEGLLRLARIKTLGFLGIKGCSGISEAGKEQFRSMLPDCGVFPP